jgi:hypothetical protein
MTDIKITSLRASTNKVVVKTEKHTTCYFTYTEEYLKTLHTKELLKLLGYSRADERIRKMYMDLPDVHADVIFEYIKTIKNILKDRPHVPNKKEAKLIRQQKAKR